MESPDNFNLNKIETLTYGDELEKLLGVSEIIDKLEKKFDLFLLEKEKNKPQTQEGIQVDSELRLLSLAKLFIKENREEINIITKKNSLSGFDCLTTSIIICLLVNRKGIRVKIGRPDKFSRYFHALIERGNGRMFKVAGKRVDYGIKTMDTKDVLIRLKMTKPIINFVNSAKERLKK